jgi:hypothetical protein
MVHYFTNHWDIEDYGLTWEGYINDLDEAAYKGDAKARETLEILARDYTTSVRMVFGVDYMVEIGLKPYSD